MAQAIAVMLEKHGVACDLMHGSDGESVVDDPKKAFLAPSARRETRPRRFLPAGKIHGVLTVF